MNAELIWFGWPLERAHDLQRLAKLLKEHGSDLVSSVRPLVNSLTEAYFTERYPGFDLDDPDWPTLHRQLEETGHLLVLVKANVT